MTFIKETSRTIDAGQNRFVPALAGGFAALAGGLARGLSYAAYELITKRTLELEEILANENVSNRMSTQATDKMAAELQLLKG